MYVSRPNRIGLPTTVGSEANRLRQRSWLRMTTALGPIGVVPARPLRAVVGRAEARALPAAAHCALPVTL